MRPEVARAAIDAYARITRDRNDVHIKIGLYGGEPFVFPGFLKIVKALADMNHHISVVTNFTASQKSFQKFLKTARGHIHFMPYHHGIRLDFCEEMPGLPLYPRPRNFAEKD